MALTKISDKKKKNPREARFIWVRDSRRIQFLLMRKDGVAKFVTAEAYGGGVSRHRGPENREMLELGAGTTFKGRPSPKGLLLAAGSHLLQVCTGSQMMPPDVDQMSKL